MRNGPSLVGVAIVLAVATATAVAADTPLATTSLVVRNRPDPEDATARRITWTARDAAVVTSARGSAGDPRCTSAGGSGAGGTIRIFSDRSAGSTEDTGDVSLPCANWKATGRDAHPTGYVYVDDDQSDGPCRRVTVTNGKGVKAICTGKHGPLDYDLVAGVDQGDVGVVARLGMADRWCGSADADHGHDGSDGRIFRGRRAPAPATCPVPFVCGDGIIVPGEQCDDQDLHVAAPA
jgi:hypothetical protein